jgi:hypothetical protein
MRENKYAHWHNDNYPPPHDKWATRIGIILVIIAIIIVYKLS